MNVTEDDILTLTSALSGERMSRYPGEAQEIIRALVASETFLRWLVRPAVTQVGVRVSKPNGYPFEGTIQAIFENRAGEIRVVAELDRGFDGDMLHIFSLNQLELMG